MPPVLEPAGLSTHAGGQQGNFIGSHHVTGVLLPLDHLDPELSKVMALHGFRDSVGSLEAILRVEGTEILCEPWDEGMMALYRRKPGVGVHYCQLVEAYKEIPKHAIAGVLQAVPDAPGEFLVQLRRAHPDLSRDEAGLAALEAAEVSRLVRRVVYNNCTFQEDHSMGKQHIQAGRDLSVGGDFIVADAIHNSFKKVAASVASPSVKDSLKQLSEALAKLSPHLAEDKQKEVGAGLRHAGSGGGETGAAKKFMEMAAEGLKQTVSLALVHAPAVIAFVDAVLNTSGSDHYDCRTQTLFAEDKALSSSPFDGLLDSIHTQDDLYERIQNSRTPASVAAESTTLLADVGQQ